MTQILTEAQVSGPVYKCILENDHLKVYILSLCKHDKTIYILNVIDKPKIKRTQKPQR